MPVLKSNDLLRQLQHDARRILNEARLLERADSAVLGMQPSAGSWSIAEVLEHLNFYSRSYLPKLRSALSAAGQQAPDFAPGWLGNYFTKMMLPGQDGRIANKMSAPKDSRPAAGLDAAAVVAEFLRHQEELLQLLQTDRDLTVRIPNSITSLIKLKAGDTFRFLIAHQQRHLAQAHRAAAAIGYEWV